MNPRAASPVRRPGLAFTIIELMVVIIIIAIVIAIVVPSLGGARDSARAASTQSLMTNIVQAASKFEQDKKRAPGLFTARDMGRTGNTTRGFSAMENVMLELAGGVVATTGPQPPNTIGVGPIAGQEAWVNTKTIGIGAQYWVPPPKFYVAQTNDGAEFKQFGVAGNTAPLGVDQLPDVVDAWGAPLLAWVRDDTSIAEVDGVTNFLCRVDSGGTGNLSARYYWASNAAFLKSNSLGKKAYNQVYQAANPDVQYSMLGDLTAATDRELVMDCLIGNPNYFVTPMPASGLPLLPAEGRSAFFLQSAGADGYYFGSKDKGAKRITPVSTNPSPYSVHFVPLNAAWPAARYLDKNGKATTDDVLRDFNDITVGSSN